MIRTLSGNILGVFLLLALLAGCNPNVAVVTQPVPTPSFPPQHCMESGDYAACLKENQKQLEECEGEEENCVPALFNLGFLHAYSKSPYQNQPKAIKYFEALIEKYPGNPLSFQATAWVDLMKKQADFEKRKRRLSNELKSTTTKLKTMDTELKTKDTELKTKDSELKTRETEIDDLQEQVERSRELETTIIDLQEQMKRSREIDVEIDRKEREVLQ